MIPAELYSVILATQNEAKFCKKFKNITLKHKYHVQGSDGVEEKRYNGFIHILFGLGHDLRYCIEILNVNRLWR